MNDLISRQNAIDALGEEPLVWHEGEDEIAERNQWRRDVNAIKAVTSAQPEIIRCKDCDNYQTDWIPESVPDRRYCATMDSMMPKDGYCSYAERRTDEAD